MSLSMGIHIYIYMMKENVLTLKADNIWQKLLRINTTQMIKRFSQIHLFMPDLNQIIWNKQQKVLVATFSQIKQNSRVFKDGPIFLLNSKLLKSVDQLLYLGSYILSTESDVNICVIYPTYEH